MDAKFAAVVAIAALAFFSFLPFNSNAQSINTTNLGRALNQTYGIISMANQSAYLLFYPNLTTAYADYYLAVNESGNHTRLQYVYSLLNSSIVSAESEQARIQSYSGISTAVLFVVGAAAAAMLSWFMLKKNRKKKS